MKSNAHKLLLGVVLVGMGIYIIVWSISNRSSDEGLSGMKTLHVGDVALTVEVADSEEEHARGLMHRNELFENHGMIFIFDNVAPRSFWNKNTLIPLDVIWIENDVIVGTSSLRSIQEGLMTVSSPRDVNVVLEVNHGWSSRHDIRVGDTITLPSFE